MVNASTRFVDGAEFGLGAGLGRRHRLGDRVGVESVGHDRPRAQAAHQVREGAGRLGRKLDQARHALEQVHRQYRRELVLWEPPGGLVPTRER